ncbi:hypothetical protein K437DRAFT_244257 [Tilletiaria anomala UBC 951]|uniref:Protein BCP1 n=1 Tax=Tilletiaria anomala (strain ATCC 24038 / CBS 436.72 / UBC 951) TaxID=1037660 RepID=A0A066WHS6_TILAU|nr:uncharacterized protein K437DRAFT_244257 [Tilletiaria anomala UBC 951]KDN52083.1 hypothetical protein K437DRAFT_244257 [Tilletiaria anomala UBC 951]
MSGSNKRKAGAGEGDASDSGSDVDMISVDFVFNAPAEIDYQALKRLFVQLFYTHAPKLDAGLIADYIINTSKDRGVGTVIKVQDDEDNDPFAVVSAGRIAADSPESISQITKLFLECVPKTAPLHDLLSKACSCTAEGATLILHERMINMPAAVASPLYRLLNEELDQLYAKGEPKPSHYLLFSRVFAAAALSSDEEMEDEAATAGKAGKRRRKAGAKATGTASMAKASSLPDGDDMGMFHPEDAIISKHASHTCTFRFPPPRDAADSFETPLFGRLVAVPREKWPAAVKEMEEAFAGGA